MGSGEGPRRSLIRCQPAPHPLSASTGEGPLFDGSLVSLVLVSSPASPGMLVPSSYVLSLVLLSGNLPNESSLPVPTGSAALHGSPHSGSPLAPSFLDASLSSGWRLR